MYGVALAAVIIADLIAFFPQRRRIKIRNIILLGFMIYIAFHVRQTPDIKNYMLRFNHDYAGHDYGFIYLAHLFRNHGASYFEFQSWYFLVAISFIAYGLILLTNNRTLVYILYFFFPFLLNLVQLRNFMVLAFLILAIGMCYGNENKIAKRIWWCVLCTLAATQHIVAIAYIPFVFVWDKKKALRYIVLGSSIVTILLLVAPSSVLNLIMNIVNLVADEKRAAVYGVKATHLGIIVMVSESIAMMHIAKFAASFIREYNRALIGSGIERYIESTHFDFVVNLLYFSSIFWPFYYLNGNYARLMQNEFLIVYMAIATMLRYVLVVKRGVNRNVKMGNAIIISISIFIPLYVYNLITLWGNLFEEVVVPIMSNLY